MDRHPFWFPPLLLLLQLHVLMSAFKTWVLSMAGTLSHSAFPIWISRDGSISKKQKCQNRKDSMKGANVQNTSPSFGRASQLLWSSTNQSSRFPLLVPSNSLSWSEDILKFIVQPFETQLK
jgi:hypothetical protein